MLPATIGPRPTPHLGFDTALLHDYLDRWQGGDRAAADELLRAAGVRLENLVRRMFRGFSNLKGVTEAADILQGSLVRLLRTLRTVRPRSTRDFFNLAAVHIRRELLDLARRYRRGWVPLGGFPIASGTPGRVRVEPADPAGGDDFELWARFHEAVEQLPEDEREVVGMVFYHGCTRTQVAAVLGLDERTVRRRWASACDRIRQLVGWGM